MTNSKDNVPHYSYQIPSREPELRKRGHKGKVGRKGKPQKIGGVLQQTLKRFGLDKDLARYEFVNHWGDIVGDEIAKRSTPECIRGKTLVVRVENSTWAQELHFLKASIIARLQQFVGDSLELNDVHFYVVGTQQRGF